MKNMNLTLLGLCFLALTRVYANPFTGSYAEDARESADLTFSAAVALSTPVRGNQTYSPQAPKANSPAVILAHNCAGLNKSSEDHLASWTSFFIKNGFYVLVIDHLSPRSKSANCGKDRTVSNGRLAKDLLDATHFLSTTNGIDKNRIYAVGFSLGGMSAGLVASQSVYDQLGNGRQKPRAVASLYGGCYYPQVNRRYLHEDTSIPTLWLMGEDDPEAPVNDCSATFSKLKATRKDFVHHVYSGTSHCWDCKKLDGFSKNFFGKQVTYRYSESAARDSEERILKFFEQHK
jgi:dienelactone hydrolase